MFDKISAILVPIAGRLNNNRYLGVLRDAFMLAFPLTIFGSIMVVLMNLPFLDKIMSKTVLEGVQSALNIAPSATISIMSVFVVFGIGYYLSKSYDVEAVFGGVIALASFLLLNSVFTRTRRRCNDCRRHPSRSFRCKGDVPRNDHRLFIC